VFGSTTSETRRQKAGLRKESTGFDTRYRALLARLWRGRPQDPTWERPTLLLLLTLNAVLYGWNLGINGFANNFYSAAVQSGMMDPKAFFFGSSDWGNSITVDKPPLSLWVMGICVRLFGFSPTAILLPQVVMGVGTTLLIYLILRRCVSAVPALFGAAVFFTTPIITLMSRYNNPDPLMLLLMVSAAWYVLHSIESGRGRFFVIAGALLGLAFMTKQLQGLLNVPALGLAFALFSPQAWRIRVATIAAGLAALAVTGGLWMTIVDLIPADSRPYVGGSPTNSVLELTFAYNGVERIAGGEATPKVMQAPSEYSPVASDAGLFRLLNVNYNQEATWLLFAGILAVFILAFRWRDCCRTPELRALSLASVVWLCTVFILLSFMGNQIHTYYTAALAPPLALVLSITLDKLVVKRKSLLLRIVGATLALVGLLTTWLIMSGTSGWPGWLPSAVLGVGIAATAALVIEPPTHRIESAAAGLLAASLLLGPTATSLHNVTLGFSGSNPLSGMLTKNPTGISHLLKSLSESDPVWGHDIVMGRIPEEELIGSLRRAQDCTWAAATYPSQTAARLQIALERPVMPLGGFAGNDPSPTLEEFQEKVAGEEVCYLVEQEAFTEVREPEWTSSAISRWVHENYSPERVGNTTVYRLLKD
jgi:4-amino-4-deoxy-L-arabinose transferase-like glycosyltransferase